MKYEFYKNVKRNFADQNIQFKRFLSFNFLIIAFIIVLFPSSFYVYLFNNTIPTYT